MAAPISPPHTPKDQSPEKEKKPLPFTSPKEDPPSCKDPPQLEPPSCRVPPQPNPPKSPKPPDSKQSDPKSKADDSEVPPSVPPKHEPESKRKPSPNRSSSNEPTPSPFEAFWRPFKDFFSGKRSPAKRSFDVLKVIGTALKRLAARQLLDLPLAKVSARVSTLILRIWTSTKITTVRLTRVTFYWSAAAAKLRVLNESLLHFWRIGKMLYKFSKVSPVFDLLKIRDVFKQHKVGTSEFFQAYGMVGLGIIGAIVGGVLFKGLMFGALALVGIGSGSLLALIAAPILAGLLGTAILQAIGAIVNELTKPHSANTETPSSTSHAKQPADAGPRPENPPAPRRRRPPGRPPPSTPFFPPWPPPPLPMPISQGQGGGAGGPGGPSVGGVLFENCATVLSGIREITGAYWDENTRSVVLLGHEALTNNLLKLHLPNLDADHLKVAIRAALLGDPLGVSIDPPSQYRIASGEQSLPPHGTALFVSYFGSCERTLAGAIFFEADRIMKCLSAGVDNKKNGARFSAKVKGFASTFEMHSKVADINTNSWHRFWFVVDHVELIKADEGKSILFGEVKIAVKTELEMPRAQARDTQDEIDAKFARHLTDNYEAYEKEYPVFSRLKEVAKINAIASYLVNSNVSDLGSLIFEHPEEVSTPETTPSILRSASFHNGNMTHIYKMSGGVSLGINQGMGYEIKLTTGSKTSLRSSSEKNLIIIGKSSGQLWFRILDSKGRSVLDLDEVDLGTAVQNALERLKSTLIPRWEKPDMADLPAEGKSEIIELIADVLGKLPGSNCTIKKDRDGHVRRVHQNALNSQPSNAKDWNFQSGGTTFKATAVKFNASQRGHFVEQDHEFPGQNGLKLIRIYAPRQTTDAMFGTAWHLMLPWSLSIWFHSSKREEVRDPCERVESNPPVLVLGDAENGKAYFYRPIGAFAENGSEAWGLVTSQTVDGGNTSFRYDQTSLIRKQGDRFIREYRGKTVLFDSRGRLMEVMSPSEGLTRYIWDGELLVRIENSDGQRYLFTYCPLLQDIQRIQSSSGEVIEYFYDDSFGLKEVWKTKDKQSLCNYHSNGKLAHVRRRVGPMLEDFRFDEEGLFLAKTLLSSVKK